MPWITVWTYRVYGIHGITRHYFLAELREWQSGVIHGRNNGRRINGHSI